MTNIYGDFGGSTSRTENFNGAKSIESSEGTTFTWPQGITDNSMKHKSITLVIFKENNSIQNAITDIINNPTGVAEQVVDKIKSKIDEVKKQVEEKNNKFMGALNAAGGAIKSILAAKLELDQEVEYRITLPLPNEISESLGQDYSFESIQTLTKGLVESANGFLDESQKVIQSQGTGFMNKIMLDPQKFQNWNGPKGARNFSFTFKLVPYSGTEANEILKIFYNIKAAALPSRPVENDGSILLRQPKFVAFEFGNPLVQKMISPIACVISNIDIDYTSGGQVSMTGDGMPKVITVKLELEEVRIITREDFLKE